MTKIKEQKIESAEVMPIQNAVHVQQSTPDSLIALAVEKNLDVDKLEKLLQLKAQWDATEARKAYYQALSRFQSILPEIRKTKRVSFPTKTGGQMEYYYAPLSEIIKQIQDPLAACDLSYKWETVQDPQLITVTCRITHIQGHSESNVMSAPLDESGQKNAIQQRGSTISYLQRYTLTGALGIGSADSDVDGQGRDKSGAKSNLKPPSPDQFKKILLRAKTETNILEEAQKAFSLTEDQVQSIKAVMPKES